MYVCVRMRLINGKQAESRLCGEEGGWVAKLCRFGFVQFQFLFLVCVQFIQNDPKISL